MLVKREDMNYPVSEFRCYSMVKDGEVVVESADKLIAEKWLERQKNNGVEDVYIVENLNKKDTVIFS